MALVRKSAPNLATVHKPFPYQNEAFIAIRDLEYSAVFHEQGLGKTKIAIDVALYWLEQQIVDSVVIVTKKGLVANWQKEFRIHTKVKPKVFTGDRADNHYSFHSTSPFFVTHYEAVKSEAERFELFAKSRRIGMILDEAHKIKNPEANITHAFHELAPLFKKRLILTGSPIANRPYDLWAQVWFLDQGEALGQDFRKFKSMLDIPRDESSSASQSLGVDVFEDELGQLFPKIKPFSVRETKDTAGIHLPSKHYRQVTARFESDQRNMYEAIRDEMRLEVLKDGLIEEDVSDDLLKRLLRLVQVASNPALVDERYIAEPGKVQPLRELVGKISANDEKVIIWTSFVDNVGWLARLFGEYRPVRVHGRMAMNDRQKSIDAFLEDPTVRVLIATPQSAKEGLTLTVANHVIFYDRTFSLDDYIQAQDRIHRISQERDCYVYNLTIEGSIDGWTNMLIEAKQAAASYGQGDIEYEEYRRKMRYDVASELRSVLGIED